MNVSRRSVLKGIGAASASLAFAGYAGAEESAQFVVSGGSNAASRIEQAGFEVERELGSGDVLHVVGPASDRTALEEVQGVQHVARNARFEFEGAELDATLDDAEFEPPGLWDQQWDKHVTDVVEAHDTATGEGARVAVLDTGIDPTHPDLAANVNEELSALFSSGNPIAPDENPWDMDGHGTHVAGTVAATGDVGVIGTAPDAELVSLKVFWFEEFDGEVILTTTMADILAAITAAAEIDADAANMSLGTPPLEPSFNAEGTRVAYERVIQYASKEGTVVVASAGNSDANLQQGGFFTTPNSTAGALSVSATGPNDRRSFYSNYGTNEIDVGAPGGGYETEEKTLEEDPTEVEWPFPLNMVLSTVPGGEWAWMAGTSMAAPQVAGTVALVRELAPNANANQVESAIKHGAEGATGKSDADLGAGRINAANTVQRLDG